MTSYGSVSQDDFDESSGLYQVAPESQVVVEKSPSRTRRVGLLVILLAGLAVIGVSLRPQGAKSQNLRASESNLEEMSIMTRGKKDPSMPGPDMPGPDVPGEGVVPMPGGAPAPVAPMMPGGMPAPVAPMAPGGMPAPMAPMMPHM